MSFKLNVGFNLCIMAMLMFGASALQCFSCSNQADDKCGVTWGYGKDGGEGDNYLVKCEGPNAVCRKIQSEDTTNGGMVVTRDCWNLNSTEQYKPPNECREFFLGKVCYCSAEEPCNGQQPLQPFTALILLVLAPLVRYFF